MICCHTSHIQKTWSCTICRDCVRVRLHQKKNVTEDAAAILSHMVDRYDTIAGFGDVEVVLRTVVVTVVLALTGCVMEGVTACRMSPIMTVAVVVLAVIWWLLFHCSMSAPATGRKTPVDHGVQIRFINDLHETGAGQGGQSRREVQPRREGSGKSAPRYGVAVRVQGIAGQPYVVLKEGEKGDSYGVQLRTQPHGPPPSYNSLPRRREDGPAQGQYLPSAENSHMRRAQSHGSLLDRENGDDFDYNFRRPPGDGRSGSYGNLDAGIGVGSERERTMQRSQWGGSHQLGLNGSVERDTHRGGSTHYTGQAGPNSNQTLFNRTNNSSSGQASSFGGSSRGSSPALDVGTRPSTASTTFSAAPPAALNTYSSPTSSSPASAYSSLGRTSGSVAKVAAVPSSANDWSSLDGHVTPDILMDQGQSSGSEFMNEEDQIQHMIYSALRQGSNENDAIIKRRVRAICDKIQALKVSRPDSATKAQLEQSLDENVHLQEQLGRKKTELEQTHTELTQLRMDRENAESRVRQLEDQLAGLQDELRRETHNRAQNESIESELQALRTELSEAVLLNQKQEDTLRQRERELTALKGALKDEVSTHDKEMETLREQYSHDMEKLRSSMEQVSQ
ncbi:hypothetical protein NFI96_028117, partial [Prochilodus magdalenae]